MNVWLVMQAYGGHERRFAVKQTTIIGREPTCDVRVPLPAVSLKHCQLTFDGERVKLVDLHSNNGTYHNGNRVSEAVLSPDDTLTIGPVTFTVHLQHEPPPAPPVANGVNGHADNAQRAPEIIIERHDDANGQLLNGELHDGAPSRATSSMKLNAP